MSKSKRGRQQAQTATCKQKQRPTEKHVHTKALSIPSRHRWLSAEPFSYHKYKQSQRKTFTSSHSHVTLQKTLFLSTLLYLKAAFQLLFPLLNKDLPLRNSRQSTHTKKKKNVLIRTMYSTQSSVKQLKLPRRI